MRPLCGATRTAWSSWDEAYVAFGGQSALPLTKKYPNVIVVRTFSKSRSMAGVRLGFAVGSAELIEDLRRLKFSTNPYSVNRAALAAGVAAVRDSAYYEANCALISAERERFAAALRGRGAGTSPARRPTSCSPGRRGARPGT